MKAEQRKPYREMAHQLARDSRAVMGDDWIPFSICHLCRFEDIRKDDDGDCTHPLEPVQERFYDVWAGVGDCWGFRPKGRTPEDSADDCRRSIEYEVERRQDGQE